MAVSLLLVLNSCSYVERDFLGEWEVYDLELKSEWRGNIVDDAMREQYKDISYEFLPEGKMIYKQGSYTANGTWDIDGENLHMKYKMSNMYGGNDSHNLRCKILSCTADKMALSMKFQENETWILYFQTK